MIARRTCRNIVGRHTDYLFAGAGAFLGTGTQLLRFFAIFYTSTQIITFAAQTFLNPKVLQQMGIGRTISVLPFAVGAGSLCSLLIPVFPTFALIRSLEFVLRGSLYRSGYELLFTPVPPREKRAAKTLIDVAFDRAGDALGSAVVQLFLWVGASYLTSGLLGIALVLAAAGVWISLRLDRSIQSLRTAPGGSRVNSIWLKSRIRRPAAPWSVPVRRYDPRRRSTMPPRAVDATLTPFEAHRNKRTLALKGIERPAPVVAAQLLRLWHGMKSANLCRGAAAQPDNITGLLIDHLVNQNVQFGIRRRVPRILRNCNPCLRFRD